MDENFIKSPIHDVEKTVCRPFWYFILSGLPRVIQNDFIILRQHCWTRGGNPSDMIFGPTVHSVISVARSRTMQHAVPDVIGYYFNKRVGPILGRGDEIREEGHSHLEVIWVCAAYKTHLFTLISSSGDPQFHVNLPLRSPNSQFSPKKLKK